MSISVRLDEQEMERLQNLAKSTRRTVSSYIRELLDEHLDDLEDTYLGERELRALKQGKIESRSLEEVSKDLGLDD